MASTKSVPAGAVKIDWNRWRSEYPIMSWADHVAFYENVFRAHPIQRHFSYDRMDDFFSAHDGITVLEVGGWRGEAAHEMVPRHGIETWINYEICAAAVHNSITTPGYTPIHPDDWPWKQLRPAAQLGVLSHVIEHLSSDHLDLLLGWLAGTGVTAIYVESPLDENVDGWHNYGGSHILDLDWPGAESLFARAGFTVESGDGDVRVFAR